MYQALMRWLQIVTTLKRLLQIATTLEHHIFFCNYFVFYLLLLIFAQTNLNITTLSSRKTACNKLNFKEVHEVPPPINLDVTGCDKPSQSDEKLPSYALRLIRRLLTIVDADFTNISF